jgi:uncharacterized protein
MQCPKCKAEFESITTAVGEVDRCTNCKGLWFDLLEHEDQKEFAAVLDIGTLEQGQQHNSHTHINCPRCPNSPMLRMVDATQVHIAFESCPVCFGRFFDAGEYQDLSDHSLGEMLRRLWKK